MAHLKDLLPQIRAKAQAAVHNKLIPPPTPMEIEEAGEYLQAYREFWRRVEESGVDTPQALVEELWQETFGELKPATYLGFSLVNNSIHMASQHIGAQSAFFVIFASGINDILWSDQIEDFLKSIESDEYEGLDSDSDSDLEF